jgi:L-threonylcarbamoyladenylate synthase
MAPEQLDVRSPDAVDRTAECLSAGGLVVLPTDTVYGLAVLGDLDQLYAAKQRPSHVPIAVLVADERQVEAFAVVDDRARRLMAEHWPGALTLVLSRKGDASTGDASSTIGVRCPDDAFLRSLASRVGPISTTSANVHGQPTPELASEVLEQLGDVVDLVVDGGRRAGVASTVADLTGPELRVLRQGPVTLEGDVAPT